MWIRGWVRVGFSFKLLLCTVPYCALRAFVFVLSIPIHLSVLVQFRYHHLDPRDLNSFDVSLPMILLILSFVDDVYATLLSSNG